MNYNIYWCFLLLFLSQSIQAKQIHIFGDSHASFCFSNERTEIPRKEHSYYHYMDDSISKQIEFSINWFGSKTMFSIARDRLNAINLKNFGVQEDDVVVFVFGEIDARCHIGKQRDIKKRDLEEIINSLTRGFIQAIEENKMLFQTLYCVVVSVTPPTNDAFNEVFPYHGTLEDRATITRQLNDALQSLCTQHAIDFLDIYSHYANKDGILDNAQSDGVVHVNPKENNRIKDQLIRLLINKYQLF